jgi:hypothetical protein
MTWLAVCAVALSGTALLLARSLRRARRGIGRLVAIDGRFVEPAASTAEAATALADARARSRSVRAALAGRTGTVGEPH